MRFRDLPIRRKLLLFNVASSAAALLLVCIAFVFYELEAYRREVLERIATEADMVSTNISSALLFDDTESARATLEALRADRIVLGAAVYDQRGEPFAAFAVAGETAPALDPRMRGRPAGHAFRDAHLIVFRAIESETQPIGTVVVVADLAELNERLLSYVAIAASVFLAAILAALAISWRAQRFVSQPILHLVETARVVSAQRDYSVRARPESEDEVGLLIRTFNDMLAQIQQRDNELAAARDQAEGANRAKDEFLAVVSHELRTPLTPILAWSSLLRQGRLDEAAVARAVEIIDRNARVQAQLINDLLDVSRIVSGKMKLELRRVDLAPVVEAAVESIRPTAQGKRVQLVTRLDPRARPVAGDAARLQQVLWNLLSNAVKFTPEGGAVTIALAESGDRVVVTVTDTGRGIDAAFLPHVFERFRQEDATSTRAHGGLGLGLSIVRHLTELHGGRVTVESEGLGRGATFRISLPVAPARPARAAAGDGSTEPRPAIVTPGLRVLLVDDDPDTLETVGTVLATAGAEVRTAASTAEAMDVFGTWLPDVLVSDVGMPGEDGYGLIRRLRALPPERGGRVPAVALTAYARSEDRVRLLAAGFQMHLAKPVEQEEIVAAVNAIAASMREGTKAS
jgi:signal transduction histidine kinase/ActR/RegA family two-component response regulator